jgi:hypothetical protein
MVFSRPDLAPEHPDRAISFVAKDEQHRILVEAHARDAPNDLPVGAMPSWLQLVKTVKWPAESTSKVVK